MARLSNLGGWPGSIPGEHQAFSNASSEFDVPGERSVASSEAQAATVFFGCLECMTQAVRCKMYDV